MEVALVIVAVLAVLFLTSGVVPRYVARRRLVARVDAFAEKYHAFLDDYGDKEAEWILRHKEQMQRDAQAVGQGIVYLGPPGMVGGLSPYAIFSDFFGHQTYAEAVTVRQKVELLVTIHSEAVALLRRAKIDLVNPFAWLRLTFEHIVGFPRYVLRQAGFSAGVVNSAGARVVTVIWAFLVGAAGIGAFIVAVLQYTKTP